MSRFSWYVNEAPLVDLLADLSVHKLDLVLADSPVSPTLNIRAYNHLLGESGITFFAGESEARRYTNRFPSESGRRAHADAHQKQRAATIPRAVVRAG